MPPEVGLWHFDWVSFSLGVVAVVVVNVVHKSLKRYRERRKAKKALAGYYKSHGIK